MENLRGSAGLGSPHTDLRQLQFSLPHLAGIAVGLRPYNMHIRHVHFAFLRSSSLVVTLLAQTGSRILIVLLSWDLLRSGLVLFGRTCQNTLLCLDHRPPLAADHITHLAENLCKLS